MVTRKQKDSIRVGKRKFSEHARDYNLIVAQKAGNTTCLFGEFLSQYLPIWQVFRGFTTTRMIVAHLLAHPKHSLTFHSVRKTPWCKIREVTKIVINGRERNTI